MRINLKTDNSDLQTGQVTCERSQNRTLAPGTNTKQGIQPVNTLSIPDLISLGLKIEQYIIECWPANPEKVAYKR